MKTDLLLVGGCTSAIEIALKEKARGLSVMIATPYSFFGEDICATMQLDNIPKWLRDKGLSKLPTPMDVKRLLDRLIIEAGIDFIFQTWPVKLLDNGIALANCEGMLVVEARSIIDATPQMTVARVSTMPRKASEFGSKRAIRRAIEAFDEIESGNGDAINKADFICEGRPYKLVENTAEVMLQGDTITAANNAEIDSRLATWNPLQKLTADTAVFPTNMEYYGIDPKQLVCLPHQYSGIMRDWNTDAKCQSGPGALPCIGEYDVVVVGGGTAGAASAIAAARNGAKTLLLETLSHLGGTGTQGRIASYCHGYDIGFTAELDALVAKYASPDLCKIRKWEVEPKQWCWEKLCRNAGVSVWFQSICFGAERTGDKITSILAATPFGAGTVKAKQFIDSTGNAVIAAFAGAETTFADPAEPAYQGVAMSPIVPGHEYYNTDYMFTVDSDARDVTRAFIAGRDRNRDKFDLAQLPGSRERRRIAGDILLKATDFYANRTYPDTIAIAVSNFDTHGFTVDPLLKYSPTSHARQSAEIPLRALMSPGIENLLTTGLGMSAHRDALPLIRMQSDVQNQGYAAGIIGAEAALSRKNLRSLDMDAIRAKLSKEGLLGPVEVSAATSVNQDAAIFDNPDLPALEKDYKESPDFEKALRLTMLGSGIGLKQVLEQVRNTPWDEGWDYKGMHQFGKSASRLDVAIMASAELTADCSFLLPRLEELVPESEFSHFRAVCLFLMRHPSGKASGKLNELLGSFKCHAIASYKDAIDSPFPAEIDVTERNFQLRELYLAGALHACEPGNQLAISFLDKYKNGLNRLYAIYAEKWS